MFRHVPNSEVLNAVRRGEQPTHRIRDTVMGSTSYGSGHVGCVYIYASVFDFRNYEECLMNSWFMVIIEAFDYSINEHSL